MRINKLTASFGKLENETLTLHDGLNIINAPNESGKSTWCAFTRAMLYGIDSSERQKNGYLPDKLRYAPWSGAPMEGRMELTADRQDITLVRRTKAKNAPMREFSATYTGTNIKVDGMTGTNAGEMLTGVPKDVFCRSAFIAQGSLPVAGSPELEKRINSLVSTGEEDSSYSETDARLRAWQRKRRYNRKGMLPELEAKIYTAEQKLSDMNTAADEIERLEAELENSRERCTQLEAAVTESRKQQRKQSLDKLRAARTNTALCSDRHDASMAALADKKEQLSNASGGRPLAELERELNEDIELYERTDARAEGKSFVSFIPSVVLLVFAVVCATLFMAKHSVPLAAAAALFGICGVFLLIKYLSARREIQDIQDTQSQILRKYRVSDLEALRHRYDKLYLLRDEIRAAESEERRTRGDYENALKIQEQFESETLNELDFTSGSSEAARLGRELNTERVNAERISNKIASLRGRLSAIGDPLVIASELSKMEDEHSALEDEYDALSLAIDTLREADTEIQTRFSPALGKAAAEYMHFLTGGRYEEVFLNRDFSAQARAGSDALAHDSAFLSAGTLDLMYLSIRLAVCKLAMSDEESCPLIIDDALTNLDEERYQRTIELLKTISRDRQVILFNCR